MKPITIDLSGLRDQFGLSSSQIDVLTETCVNAVTASIYENWIALAKKELHSTLPEYINNLVKVDKGRFEKQIVLTGILPNMLEQGVSAFDLKDGFKKSNKVKLTKTKKNGIEESGWYLTIPFRIGTPSALGQAGFSSVMPEKVYSVMKKQSSKQNLLRKQIPEEFREPVSREAILNESSVLFDSYKHKSSIYEGMIKDVGKYAKTDQSTYKTFRRVSSNSDKLSWIHKGIKSHNLAVKAVEKTDVETIVENEVTDYLESTL